MKRFKHLVIFILLFCYNHSVFASACTNVFPGGAQTTSGGISFVCGNQVTNSGTVLPANSVTGPGACGTLTCVTANCTPSGTPVGTLNPGPFQTDNSATNVTVAGSGTATIGLGGVTDTDRNNVTLNAGTIATPTTLNFSDHTSAGVNTYRMATLTVNQNSVVNFLPGDYWIGSLSFSGVGNHTINVVGSGTARLFVANAINVAGQQLTLNNGGTGSELLIYNYSGITGPNAAGSVIKGILYCDLTTTLRNNIVVTGAVTSADITFQSTARVNYPGSGVINAVDFGGLCPPAGTVNNFVIQSPSSGVTCVPAGLSVTAQIDNAVATTYTGQITLNTFTGAGTWALVTGSGTFVSGGGNGTATYKYAAGDQGTATFTISLPAAGSVVPRVYETFNSLIRDRGTQGSITFANTNYLMTAGAVPPTTAFNTPQTAGNSPSFTMRITRYGGGGCNVTTGYTGNQNVRLWFDYVDPTTGTVRVNVNGVTLGTTLAGAVNQTVNFAAGTATITVFYRDVGKIRLHAVEGANEGSTDVFIVKPSKFVISGTGIPAGSTSPSGTVFAKAGQPFSATVDVQGNDSINTPNYNKESSPQGIILSSSSLAAPAGGRNGSLNNGAIGNNTSFIATATPGRFQGSTFSFDEVGYINLSAGVGTGSYLGAGNVSGPTVLVGRFTPDHFAVSTSATPIFTTACSSGSGSFTYLGQPFVYATKPAFLVTAQALANTTTQNYQTGNSFWKLSTTGSGFGPAYNTGYFPVNVGDVIPSLPLNATAAIAAAPTFVDNANGTGVYTYLDGGGISIPKATDGVTLAPPFRAEIQFQITSITDTDGVTCTTGCTAGRYFFGNVTSGNGISFNGTGGGKQFFQGRMNIFNTSGSELIAMNVPLQNQYYTGGTNPGFIQNQLDSCTVMPSAATPTYITLTPSAGLTTTASFPGSTANFSLGATTVQLAAPSPAGVTGYVDLDINLAAGGANLPWLLSAWPYLGTPTNFNYDPRGRATFGIFPGNIRIIYQREITP